MKTIHHLTIPLYADWSAYQDPFEYPGAIAMRQYFGIDTCAFKDGRSIGMPELSCKAIVIKDGQCIEYEVGDFQRDQSPQTFTLTEISRKPIDMEFAIKCFEEQKQSK